jgi:O-6-methylguanine DNA methyltransferase
MPRADQPAAVFTSVPGPWGPIHIAATARGIAAIDLLAPAPEFVAALERRLGAPVVERGGSKPPQGGAAASASEGVPEKAADRLLDDGRGRLLRFLAGDRHAFEGLPVDLADRPAWDRAVLGAVGAIPWGETASYGTIARRIERTGAGRAVGGAVGRNPVSLAIPCHRVIAGDGSLGGFGGGWWGSRELRLGVKRELLAREGVLIPGSAGSPIDPPGVRISR